MSAAGLSINLSSAASLSGSAFVDFKEIVVDSAGGNSTRVKEEVVKKPYDPPG